MPDNKLPILPEQPVEVIEETSADPIYDSLFSYDKARTRINNLIDSFSEEKATIKRLRKERYVDIDVDELKESGELENDETLIPDRVIDNNINRDLPDAVNFLTGSHRLAIFRCTSNPDIITRRLENEFTKGLTYNGWFRPFFRSFDGAALHGWDAIEVVFDETKPLHVGFEHVGTDKLYFAKDVSDLQESEYCIREYSVSLFRLESYVAKSGFNAEQVKLISDAHKDVKRDSKTCIFKVYFKYNNCVYIAWYAKEGAVTDWLKAPEKLRLGIKVEQIVSNDVPVTDQMGLPVIDPMTGMPAMQTVTNVEFVDKEIDAYPIFLYLFKDDEDETIVHHKGRGFLDSPVQEATTAITTGFVNAVVRSSNVYASVKGTTDSADVQQLDIQLESGYIYSNELNFWSTPMPDVMVLSSLQYLNTKNASDTGKLATSVINRKDARKTAEELEQAKAQQDQIVSTSLTTLSEFLREVFTFGWQIVQSQAIQDLIDFVLLNQNGQYVNDIQTIQETYDIRPSGDDDIIKSEMTVNKMQQDWAVIQTTPLKDVFLQDLVALRYPEKADKYLPILQSADPRMLIQSLSVLLQNFIQPAELATLSPQEIQQLSMIAQQVQQYLGATQNETVQQNIRTSNGTNSQTGNTGTGTGQGTQQPAKVGMAA